MSELIGDKRPIREDYLPRRIKAVEDRIGRVERGAATSLTGTQALSVFPTPTVSTAQPAQKPGLVWLNPNDGVTQISDGTNFHPVEPPLIVDVQSLPAGSAPAGTFDPATSTLHIGIPAASAGTMPAYTATIGLGAAGSAPTAVFDNTAETLTIQIPAAPAAAAPPTFIAPRKVTLAVAASIYTPNCGTTDLAIIAAPTAAFTIAAPTGAKVDGQRLTMRIRSGASAFVATWNAAYAAAGRGALPASIANKTVVADFVYDSTTTKWIVASSDTTGY